MADKTSLHWDEKGRIKLGTVILLVVIAGIIYYGMEVGGVYFRRFKLVEMVQQQISFAGQLEDERIRQQIQGEIRSMNLPPEASRVGMARTMNPRTLRVTIMYSEPVNLLFAKRNIPIRVTVNRGF